jgi:hypothetical protein
MQFALFEALAYKKYKSKSFIKRRSQIYYVQRALGAAIEGACLLLRLDTERESGGKPRFKPMLSDSIVAPEAKFTAVGAQRWRWPS